MIWAIKCNLSLNYLQSKICNVKIPIYALPKLPSIKFDSGLSQNPLAYPFLFIVIIDVLGYLFCMNYF